MEWRFTVEFHMISHGGLEKGEFIDNFPTINRVSDQLYPLSLLMFSKKASKALIEDKG